MNEENLTNLLDQIRVEAIPPVPENLESTVLRIIRSARVSVENTTFFPGLLRFAFAVALFAGIVGWAIGSSRVQNDDQADRLLARNALSLEVFDLASSSFPSIPSQR